MKGEEEQDKEEEKIGRGDNGEEHEQYWKQKDEEGEEMTADEE